MSIRALALEMYRAKLKLEDLQKKCDAGGVDTDPKLLQECRAAEQEFKMLRKMLEGEKESGSHRMKFTSYTNR